jgi:photosystem II stability/assembly factor-like uncharacterized protein
MALNIALSISEFLNASKCNFPNKEVFMRRTGIFSFFAVALIGTFLCTSSALSQVHWNIVGPGCGGDLLTGAIQPDNPDIFYIGGDIEGIFKTTDGGESWVMVNNGLNSGGNTASAYAIQEVVMDPNDFETLYVCTWAGLFKSTDGAGSWNLIYPDQLEEEGPPIAYLSVDPDNGDILYCGIGNSAESEDGTGTLLKSTNGGDDWVEVDLDIGDESVIYSIIVDPISPQNNRTLLIATDTGVYRSVNNGIDWSPANNGLPHMNARRLVTHSTGGISSLFLSMRTTGEAGNPGSWSGGLYKSVDNGDNWVDITGDLPKYDEEAEAHTDYLKFDVHPVNPDIIYIGTYYSDAYTYMGIYKTVNGGDNWVKTDDGNITFGWLDDVWWDDLNVALLMISPSNPDIVVTGKDYPQKTTNAGETWTQIYCDEDDGFWQTRGMELMLPLAFGFDAADSDILYVGYDDMGFWRSNDGGTSFARLDPVQDPDGFDAVNSIAVDPANGDVYVGRNSGTNDEDNGYTVGKVQKSTDNGDNFANSNENLPAGRPAIVLDPNSPEDNRVLYCAVYGSGVYKSEDSGESWSAVNNGLGDEGAYAWAIALDVNNVGTLYLGLNTFVGEGTGGVYKTTNGGESWSRLEEMPGLDVLSVVIDPSNSDCIYAGGTDSYEWSEEGGLYKSTDDGDSWELVFTQPRVSSIQVHPENSDVIYCASQTWWNHVEGGDYGFYRSFDGGDSWSLINGNMGHTYVLASMINPYNSNQIYVGTHGGGIWMSENILQSVSNESTIPLNHLLISCYPNPFNSSTQIRYYIPATGEVNLRLFDINGRLIENLVQDRLVAGTHSISLDAADLVSGTYLIRLSTGAATEESKIILLK